MKPKKSTRSSGCPDALSSKCITWNGPSIPCIEVCNGDELTEVIWAIADKVCTIAGDIDMSTMDLSCLLDLCNGCPQEKTLQTVIQLLLDNQCKLKDLIDEINVNPTQDVELNLNLKCIKKFDEFGNEIPQNLNQTLQSIINELCDHADDITTLQNTVIDLQNQIDNIDVNPTIDEPVITTCLTGPNPVSETVISVTEDYCEYKGVVGSELDIQSAMSQQCANLNSALSSTAGWIISPENLAQTVNNLWIAYCNLLDRVKSIEDTCCAVNCDSVKIGFITTFNDNQTVTLSFTPGSGSMIPAGFVDCGSELTITNQNNVTFTVPIVIAQNGDSDDIDVSMFTTGDMLTFSLKAKLCSDTLNCEKCYGKVVKYISGCCEITNISDEPITITYQTTI